MSTTYHESTFASPNINAINESEVVIDDNLEVILTNPTERENFHRYVSTKFASESVLFYTDVNEYKLITDNDQRQIKGKEIVQKYFQDMAPKAITLSDKDRKEILEVETFNENTFDNAEKEIIQLLESNFYHSYVENKN